MNRTHRLLSLLLLLLSSTANAFTYQGELSQAGVAFSGTANFEFKLFDGDVNGNQVGPTSVRPGVVVSSGRFVVQLDDWIAEFDGADLWLDIAVDVDASGFFTALSPRQPLSPAPYSEYAYAGAGGAGAPAAWKLTGNTAGASDYVGTNNNMPLVLKANGRRIVSLQDAYGAGGSGNVHAPNILSGSETNVIAAGTIGATISGGGGDASVSNCGFGSDPCLTIAYGFWSSIGGGWGNKTNGLFSTISGGKANFAWGDFAQVSGGSSNVGSGDHSAVGGGGSNFANASYAQISGGQANYAGGAYSAIGGGNSNIASGMLAQVSGGYLNTASGDNSTVVGGEKNTASGYTAFVAAGFSNCAGGQYSFAGGRGAKVRPGSNSGEVGSGCDGVSISPNNIGDSGTFMWSGASGANWISTGSNQFLVRATGGMGIGTNAPQNALHVAKNSTGTNIAQHITQLSNTNTGTGADVLALKVGTTGSPGAGNNFITFYNGNNTIIGQMDGDGIGGVSFKSSSADFAEYMPISGQTPNPGDIVALKAGALWLNTESAERLFVVSTAPIVAGNVSHAEDGNMALVAFTGQVPVNVRGPVLAGQWLVASGKHDGIAIARTGENLSTADLPFVVGRALENSRGQEQQQVKALVGLPPLQLLSLRLSAMERTAADLLVENQKLQQQLSQLLEREQMVDKLSQQ